MCDLFGTTEGIEAVNAPRGVWNFTKTETPTQQVEVGMPLWETDLEPHEQEDKDG